MTAVLPSRTLLLCLLLVGMVEAAGRPRLRSTLSGSEEPPCGVRQSGPEPGDRAEAFTVPTLDGEFRYPAAGGGGASSPRRSVLIHAFTRQSGFLEGLWSSEESLRSLVDGLPVSAELLLLSLDESAVSDALWMREQLRGVAGGRQDLLSRVHISPLPLFSLGNWIPNVLYSWSCTGHNCGLAQAVFTSHEWKMPIVVKRLDARYDWLMTRWSSKPHRLVGVGDGCKASYLVTGSVAWASEGNCSFFTKVMNMYKSGAVGVLVHSLPGKPIRDMNCDGDECFFQLNIPAAMVQLEEGVAQALRLDQLVNVSFQTTPSPNFFLAIDQQGALAEMGWFLYPSFSFVNWQAQWFDFYSDLLLKLQSPAEVITVFNRTQMQGERGAVATVELPSDVRHFDTLELDASLSCPGRRDESCAPWDRTVQLFVCCDPSGPYCNAELGRWITAFRRGTGHWVTDVSPLLLLLDGSRCTFTVKTAPWAKPWMVSLNLRFSNQTGRAGVEKLRPFSGMPLYDGGKFDQNYNRLHRPLKFTVPPSTRKVELFVVVTGHGSDENGCGEFCVTSHHFLINSVHNNTRVFDTAGSALGCTLRVRDGAVPNEHGTWLYGRGGWCDGLQVDPWRTDVTQQLDWSGLGTNTVTYLGLYEGRDPDPEREPGYIIMSSFIIFYK